MIKFKGSILAHTPILLWFIQYICDDDVIQCICDDNVITCHCAAKLQWHHVHFGYLSLNFECYWPRSLSPVPVYAMSFTQVLRSFPTPKWWFYHWHQVPSTASIKPKESKTTNLLATISSMEIEASKKSIVVKNTQKCTVQAVHVFTSWAEEQIKCSNQKYPIKMFCTGKTTELCLNGFACLWRRPGMATDSHIHHTVSCNYFLAYSTSHAS